MTKLLNKIKTWDKFGLILTLTLFSTILLIVFSFDLYFNWRYQNKILPNVKIGEVSVGSLNKEVALEKIRHSADNVLNYIIGNAGNI